MTTAGFATGFGASQARRRGLDIQQQRADIEGRRADTEQSRAKSAAETVRLKRVDEQQQRETKKREALNKRADEAKKGMEERIEKFTPEAKKTFLASPSFGIFSDQFVKSRVLTGSTEEEARAELDVLQFVSGKQPTEKTKTVANDILVPILSKVMQGVPITPEEQTALQLGITANNPIANVIRDSLGGAPRLTTDVAPNAAPASPPAAVGGNPLIEQAQAAIAAGADPEAVKQRLIELGVDVSGL